MKERFKEEVADSKLDAKDSLLIQIIAHKACVCMYILYLTLKY